MSYDQERGFIQQINDIQSIKKKKQKTLLQTQHQLKKRTSRDLQKGKMTREKPNYSSLKIKKRDSSILSQAYLASSPKSSCQSIQKQSNKYSKSFTQNNRGEQEWSQDAIPPKEEFEKDQQYNDEDENKNMKKKHKFNQLQQIVKKQKINNIVTGFIDKVRRNNIHRTKGILEFKDSNKSQNILYANGFEINEQVSKIFQLILLIFQLSQVCVYPLNMVYSLEDQAWTNAYQIMALTFCILDFVFNLTTVKVEGGKKIILVKDIIKHYLTQHMIIDIFFICIITAGIIDSSAYTSFSKMLILAKIPWCLERLQKLEIYFIESTYKEQYWSIIKVFLFNFFYAHFLALVLSLISQINVKQSWIMQKNLLDAPWYQIYIWAYYWAVNMMLTVGFGDIVASNHIEALCLIFVQTLSCIVLAYNINCVGSLISGIRQQDLEKCKKYKIFRSLALKNKISSDLFLKVSNYIEESNNIKKNFNIEEENKFIQALPAIFKKDYLNESNKSIFNNIVFFRNLAEKAVQSLSMQILMSISHPSQQIVTYQNFLNLIILKEGKIGFCIKKFDSSLNGQIIDVVQRTQRDNPFLLGLNFLTNKKPLYQVKSLQYSINYTMSLEKLIECLKRSNGDYEYFCYLKDKSKHAPDEFQVFPCPECKTKHTKFDCPNYHYIPFEQHVIEKNIRDFKFGSNKRQINYQRFQTSKLNSLIKSKLYNNKKIIFQSSKQSKVKTLKKINVQKLQLERTRTKSIYEHTFMLDKSSAVAEKIREEISTFLKRQTEEDDIWLLALDIMENYKSYFYQDNPCNLSMKFQMLSAKINQAKREQLAILQHSFTEAIFQKICANNSLSIAEYSSSKFDQRSEVCSSDNNQG